MKVGSARLVGAVIAVAITVTQPAPQARAQRAPRIPYESPESCPLEDALRARIDEHLTHAPEGAELAPVDAAVGIHLDAGVYVARVTLVEAGEETVRELRDPSCEIVADAVAIVVAIALVPGLDVSSLPDTTLGSDGGGAQSIGGAVRLAAHGSVGVLPDAAIAAEIGGAIRVGSLRIDLAIRGAPLVGARFGGAPGSGGDIGIAVGLLRASGVLAVDSSFELFAGGGVEAGVAIGSGVGISAPRDTVAPWVAIEAAAGAAWIPWRWVALVLELEGMVPIVRPVFTIAGLGTVHRPAPVAGALRLVLELRFP